MRVGRSDNRHQVRSVEGVETRIPNRVSKTRWRVFRDFEEDRLRPVPFGEEKEEFFQKCRRGSIWIELKFWLKIVKDYLSLLGRF